MGRIDQQCLKTPFYGSRKIAKVLIKVIAARVEGTVSIRHGHK